MRALRARRKAEQRPVTQGNGLPAAVTGYLEADNRRQKTENGNGQSAVADRATASTNGNGDANGHGNANGHAPRRGSGTATLRERERLEADPTLSGLADAWARAMDRQGREITVLRAGKAALAGGYAASQLQRVVEVVAVARREPERFPDRGSIRWAVERGKTGAAYLWRPDVLDRLIPEVEAWDRE
jgi:hypothetical protein